MALAHAVGDKVEAANRRGDLFAKRGVDGRMSGVFEAGSDSKGSLTSATDGVPSDAFVLRFVDKCATRHGEAGASR